MTSPATKDVHTRQLEAALKAMKRLHEDVRETAENQRKQTLDAAVIRNRLKKVAALVAKEGKLTAAGLNALRETLGLADAFIERVDPARVEEMLANMARRTSSELASIKESLRRVEERQVSLASDLDEIKANQSARSERLSAVRRELKVLAQMVSATRQPKEEPKKAKVRKPKQPRLRGR